MTPSCSLRYFRTWGLIFLDSFDAGVNKEHTFGHNFIKKHNFDDHFFQESVRVFLVLKNESKVSVPVPFSLLFEEASNKHCSINTDFLEGFYIITVGP